MKKWKHISTQRLTHEWSWQHYNNQHVETIHMSSNWWMNKQNVGYQMMEVKYYSATKRNGILIHATTRTNLQNIGLHERNQSQKVTQYMIPLVWNVHNKQAQRGSCGRDENVLKLIVVMVALCEYTKNDWTVYFKRVNSRVCELYLSKAVICLKAVEANERV